MLFSKSKFYIKTLKTLVHASIIRSSSGEDDLMIEGCRSVLSV